MELLKFSIGNAKLAKSVATFSLPAGWTCPGARDCLARAEPIDGTISDGPKAQYRCFSASLESFKPSVRQSRWRNFNLIRSARTPEAIADLILRSVPKNIDAIRIHVGGDFFSRAYLEGWILAASARPELIFYAYTKSVHLLPPKTELPHNMRIVVSAGTKHDIAEARRLGYSVAFVVFSDGGPLPIDHDDSHAIAADHDFALLLHGTQPKGTDAALALKALKKDGFYGYNKGRGA